jgi:isoquinoline 1-oxidoreductase alpha subunit
MNGNICRCATYLRIRQAIHRAAALDAATAPVGTNRDRGDDGRDDPALPTAEAST